MKNLKILLFGTLLVGMHLTSCKKEVNQQLQQGTPSENKANVFEKSLTVYSADKTNSTTLRFRAASKEQLDKMRNVEFTLVTQPELPAEAELTAPAIKGEEGFSSYAKGATLLPTSITTKPALPPNAIQVDLPQMPKVADMALNVASVDEAVGGPADITVFYYRSNYHRIRVTNFHPRSIIVDFYNYFNGWHYSGFSYQLFQNTYAWYQHCTRTVGADVTHGNRYNYVVRFVRFCQ